jgi:hypothetical protein
MSAVAYSFTHYPTLTLSVSRTQQGVPRIVPEHELVALYSASRKSFDPLLKHLPNPLHVATLIAAFNPPSLPRNLWQLVHHLSTAFPQVLFPQLVHTIHATSNLDDENFRRRNEWMRKRLRKDLLKSKDALGRLRALVIDRIVSGEEIERDPRLLAMHHILELIIESEKGYSVKGLLNKLGGGVV